MVRPSADVFSGCGRRRGGVYIVGKDGVSAGQRGYRCGPITATRGSCVDCAGDRDCGGQRIVKTKFIRKVCGKWLRRINEYHAKKDGTGGNYLTNIGTR